MKRLSHKIITAQPGYYTVYEEDDKTALVSEPVVAWRIETFQKDNSDELHSISFPLTVDGEILSNCIGVQNPDKSITLFEDSNYENIESLNEERKTK